MTDGPEESVTVPSEQEAELQVAIEEVDRGEVISAAELRSRISEAFKHERRPDRPHQGGQFHP